MCGSEMRTNWKQLNESLRSDDQSPLLDNAVDMGMADDGRTDGFHRWTYMDMSGSSGSQPKEIQLDIYGLVFGSLGEPEFKPSNSKPSPTWMQLLPNNVHREREQQNEVGEQSLSLLKNEQSHRVANPTLQGVWGLGFTRSPEPITLMSPTLETKLSQTDIAVKLKTRPTIETASEITNKQKLGAVGRSQAMESVYSKPSKSPSSLSLPARQGTPFPRALMARDETSSYFSLRKGTVDVIEPAQDPCCQLGTPSQLPITYSAEYIEKYQPKTARATCQKYVAKDPQPILDKIKRQRVRGKSMGKAAERIVKGRRTEGNEQYELDPRREDLYRELRNLFYEERN
jgi:hypothetical protein